VAVHIRERTAYPLDCHISLAVTVAAPVAFTLRLRRPQWATGHSCVLAGQPFGEEIDGWIIIQHSWEHATSIELHFDAQPELIPYGQGELIVRCGPLLFVRPIASRERPGRAYPLPGFVDSYAEPDLTEPGSYAIDPDQAAPQLVHEPHPGEPTWEAGPRIDILLLHPQTRAATRVRLVPMGASLLRQASFPVS
jgi:hypothetical protein